MQTIPASEIKRRGIAALDGKLDQGPVYVMRNNKPACVILSEAEYERLRRNNPTAPPTAIWDVLSTIRARPEDQRKREEIDAQLKAERDSWDRD